METMTEAASTTDMRIDDLRGELHRGFAQIDAHFERLESETHRAFDQIDGRFERVETDIRELRAEMRAGHDGLRAAMQAGDDGLRKEMKAGDDNLRTEMKEGFAAVNARFDSLQRMMIGFFATTLAGIIGAVITAVLTHP